MNSATLFFLSMHKNIFISFLFPYHYTKNFHLFHVTVYNFNAHTHTHTHTRTHTHKISTAIEIVASLPCLLHLQM